MTRHVPPATPHSSSGWPWAPLLGIACLLSLAWPAPARAHANPVSAQPPINASVDEGVSSVRITFDEAVVPAATSIKVFDPTATEVDLGNSTVDPSNLVASVGTSCLGPGLYTVVWANQDAQDGHTTQGFYLFRVGPNDVPARVGFANGTVDGKGNTMATQPAGDLQISISTPAANLTLKPFDVSLQDGAGNPVGNAYVRLRTAFGVPALTLPEHYKIAQANPVAPGHYLAPLPIGTFGQWTIKLQVGRDGVVDVAAAFTLMAGAA